MKLARRSVEQATLFAPVRSQTAFEETLERLGTAIKLGLLEPGRAAARPSASCAARWASRAPRCARRSPTLVQSGHLHARRAAAAAARSSPTRRRPLDAPSADELARLARRVRPAARRRARRRGARRRARRPRCARARSTSCVAEMDAALEDFPAYRQADVRWHIGLAEATGSRAARGGDDRGAGPDERPHLATSRTRPSCSPGPTSSTRGCSPRWRKRDGDRAHADHGRAPPGDGARAGRSAAFGRVSLYQPSLDFRPTRIRRFAASERSGTQTFRPRGEGDRMSTTTPGRDEQRLAELGYKQELTRAWSGFSNFAISFTIISILAGCFTTYGQAWNNGGPIAISIGLAADLVHDPAGRVLHVRARLGLSDRRRHLLVGERARRRRPGAGSPAGSTSSASSPSSRPSTTAARRSSPRC